MTRCRLFTNLRCAAVERSVNDVRIFEAAAWAAVLAIAKARRGVDNIAESSGSQTRKARRELDFDAIFRLNAAA